jgi:putative ABC transport system permease protein
VPPALGRGFAPGEDEAGRNRVAVMSDGLWRRRFGADPTVLGRTVTLDGEPFTLIGVARPGFHFPAGALDADLWTPVPHGQLDAGYRRPGRGMSFLHVWGRLAPGVTQAQARTELDTIRARLAERSPGSPSEKVFSLRDVGSQFSGDVRTALFTLLAAVGLVLLIACANVGNLLLARATVRQRELAVLAALGANRAQIVAQLLTESALLALAGATLGLLVASHGLDALSAFLPDTLLRLNAIAVNGRVLAFAALVATATVLVFGVAPALTAARADVHAVLKAAGRGLTGRGHRTRTAMLVGQISLAFVLLVGAGLALRSFSRVTAVDPGFEARDLLVSSVSLPSARYPTPEKVRAFYRAALPRLQALPGAERAAIALPLPFSPMAVGSTLDLPGRSQLPADRKPSVAVRFISPDYLSLMRVPLLGGRTFVPPDEVDGAPPVAVVSESLARQLWPGEPALGKRLAVGMVGDGEAEREVVGVVADVKTRLEAPGLAEIYVPFVESPFNLLAVVVKSPRPQALAGSLRAAVLAVDPAQPLDTFGTMEQRLADSVRDRRLSAVLLALFAGLALLLAAIGIYGVLSYTVAQRTREVGIRMALGARAGQVWRLLVGQALRWALLGLALGLAAALALTRILASQLYGVSPTDPLTFTTLALLLLIVATAASLLPARRATRIDPMIAMRQD